MSEFKSLSRIAVLFECKAVAQLLLNFINSVHAFTHILLNLTDGYRDQTRHCLLIPQKRCVVELLL
jgi:hypothetical protein